MQLTLRSPPADAKLVGPNLFVGSRPPYGRYRWINVIVLCAQEFQPPSFAYPGATVIHAPLNDTPEFMPDIEKTLAVSNAKTIVRHLRGGQRVMVTCHSGLNRSALIAGLAMQLAFDLSADDAIEQIRSTRDHRCLSNPQFIQLMRDVDKRRRR